MKSNIKIYVSSSAFQTIEEAFSFAEEHACNVEISKFARPSNLDTIQPEDISLINQTIANKNFKKPVLHGVCYDLFPASLDQKIVNLSLERLQQSLSLAKELNAKTIVFHAGYNGQIQVVKYIEKFIEKQIVFWKTFIENNDLNGITIALENTYEDNPEILKDILNGVGKDNFKTCMDIGHINVYSHYSLDHWINILWDHLHHFHIHFNNGKLDKHSGFMDHPGILKNLYRKITKKQSDLSLTFEMFKKEDIIHSLSIIKNIDDR